MKMLLNRMRWVGSRIMTAAMSSVVWSIVSILDDDGETGPQAPPISDFYGVGAGQIPIRLRSSEAVMAGGFVQRIPNAGGVGEAFDLVAGSSDIPLTQAGAMSLTPTRWLRFSNVPGVSAPDLMATTIFIVADVSLEAVDQYFLGSGNPQANVWLQSNGFVLRFSRRNPTTNSVESVFVGLSPIITSGLRLYEIEFIPGVPAENGRTTGGTINVRVNGELRGTAAHPYPEFRAWNFASGQNPVSGNGLNAQVFDTLSLVQGGAYDERRAAIRQRLNGLYDLGMETAPPPNTGGQPVTLVNETGQPVALITRT